MDGMMEEGRATSATLRGEAEAASGKPAAAGRTTGAGGTGAQRHGGAAVGMAGSGCVGRGGGAQGAQQRRPRRRDCAAEEEGRRDDHGDRAVAGEDCPPRGRRPFGTSEVEAMSQAVSPSVDRVYGLARVARCWNVSRATVYRHRQAPIVPKRRPGPVGPCDDATLLEHIRKAIAESRFTGEGYRKMWARLRFSGVRSSPGRVRRLMRENALLAPHRIRKRPDKAHDGTITTEDVDVLWGTDMTQSVTLTEGVAPVFVAVDHCNSECVRRQARQPLPSPGAGPPGCAPTLRRHRQEHGRRPHAPARPRTELYVRRFPERDRLPRHRGFALLRAPARGQRRRRALHPDAEGKPLVGAPLRDHRGVAPGAARFRRLVQYPLAGRPPWPQDACSDQGRPATGHGSGRMNDAAACLTTLMQYTAQFRPQCK